MTACNSTAEKLDCCRARTHINHHQRAQSHVFCNLLMSSIKVRRQITGYRYVSLVTFKTIQDQKLHSIMPSFVPDLECTTSSLAPQEMKSSKLEFRYQGHKSLSDCLFNYSNENTDSWCFCHSQGANSDKKKKTRITSGLWCLKKRLLSITSNAFSDYAVKSHCFSVAFSNHFCISLFTFSVCFKQSSRV